MKQVYLYTPVCLLLFMMVFITSCSGQANSKVLAISTKTDAPIGEYVVEIFEDSKGNLWFGTVSEGVARYNAKTLTYFSTENGLAGNTVASIVEDKEGNLWFGTHTGLSKYDGKTFTNFTSKEGLCNDRVSSVFIDSKSNIWVGTWGGVCRYDGNILLTGQAGFSDFPLPIPDVQVPDYQATANWVTEIIEDKQGNIWFGCRVAEKDNPDANAKTGDGGLTRYDGKTFVPFPALKGLSKNDIYTIYEDKAGSIWIGATGIGAYRYDGSTFTLFKETDREDLISNFGMQSMLEDSNGTLWFGFSGGLFRFNGVSFVNVTQGSIVSG